MTAIPRVRSGSWTGWSACSVFLFAGFLGVPYPLPAQAGQDALARDAYVEAVASHFGVPAGEVRILAEGPVLLDEVAVVLRVAQLSGISSSAIVARRRSAEGWLGIARRHGLGAGAFHEEIPEGQVDDRIRRAWNLFREQPSSGWDAIQLTDAEVVTLVNLRVLSREFGVSYGRVLEARARSDSFAQSVRSLTAPGR